jgi:hypothetical protein
MATAAADWVVLVSPLACSRDDLLGLLDEIDVIDAQVTKDRSTRKAARAKASEPDRSRAMQ